MQLAMLCFVLKTVLLTPRTGGKSYAFQGHMALEICKSVGNTAGEVNGQSEIHYLK